MVDHLSERLAEGEKRAQELSLRYGLPIEKILEAYREFQLKAKAGGFEPSMRAFEILLRIDIARNMPEIKNVEPIYCKGLDPLHPYNPTKQPILLLLVIVIALIALAMAWFR